MTFPILAWAPGATIEAEAPGIVRVSLPGAGRTWRFEADRFEHILKGVLEQTLDRSLAEQLARLGLLIHEREPDRTHWGVVRRYHEWSQANRFRDGADTQGDGRQAVLDLYSADDLEQLRTPPTPEGEPALIGPFWASILAPASARISANRDRLSSATNAAELLYSYGAAHGFVLVSRSAGELISILADPTQPGRGVALSRIPLEDYPELKSWSPQSVLVVGDMTSYRRRYRHEKALQGFFVDGGRLGSELCRSLRAHGVPTTTFSGLYDPEIVSALGLTPLVHHLFSVHVVANVPQSTNENSPHLGAS